ncbi:MAG TPA: 50S ribosomal protein L25 [Candidatus Pacearchaeota archaeon]|nr:50S ribosomal protein L25 [Candidatus Pacearchaeota archaeon]
MLTIDAKIRELKGRKTEELRREGMIPAVLYGPGIENKDLTVTGKEFANLFRQAGKSSLVGLRVENEAKNFMVLINDLSVDPVSGKTIHIDFYQPDLKKEIEADVPLVFVGESPAVKDLGGTLIKNFDEIAVKALPADLPREIKVDISVLKNFDDAIAVKDLTVAGKVELLKNPEEIVALAAEAQKIDEELEKPIEEDVDSVAKVVKEKKEEVSEEEAAPSGKK